MSTVSERIGRIDWDRMPAYTAEAHRLRAMALRGVFALAWQWASGLLWPGTRFGISRRGIAKAVPSLAGRRSRSA